MTQDQESPSTGTCSHQLYELPRVDFYAEFFCSVCAYTISFKPSLNSVGWPVRKFHAEVSSSLGFPVLGSMEFDQARAIVTMINSAKSDISKTEAE